MSFAAAKLAFLIALSSSFVAAEAAERPGFADENCECSALLGILEFESTADEEAMRPRMDRAAARFEISCVARMGSIYKSHIERYADYWRSLPDGIASRTSLATTLAHCGKVLDEDFRGLSVIVTP